MHLARSHTILIGVLVGIVASTLAADPPATTQRTTAESTSRPGDEVTSRPARDPPREPGGHHSALYTARSSDGLAFTAESEPLIRDADAPTIARLGDRRLLLVFEYSPRGKDGPAGLGSSFSTDDGRHWSEPRPLEVKGLPRSAGVPREPALAIAADGEPWLFVVAHSERGRRAVCVARWVAEAGSPAQRESSPVKADDLSAFANGAGRDHPPAACSFRFAHRVEFGSRRLVIDDLAVIERDRAWHLFGNLFDSAGACYHGSSLDSRRFQALDEVHFADIGSVGCILLTPAVYRCYSTSPAGIISSISTDARAWTRESGVRLADAAEPAVVQLNDDSWLMVYAKYPAAAKGRQQRLSRSNASAATGDDPPTRANSAAPLGAERSSTPPDGVRDADAPVDAGGDEAAGDYEAVEDSGENEPGEEEAPPLVGEDDWRLPPFAKGMEEAGLGLADGETGGEAAPPGAARYVMGVPVPDFVTPIDYRAWLEQRHDLNSVPDNAWNYYAALMFDPIKGPTTSAMPLFGGMMHDIRHVGPSKPWDPIEHPEWEEAYLLAAPYLARYAEAAAHPDYVRPLQVNESIVNESANAEGEDIGRLLIGVMLPDLAGHRALAKQTLSDAWRAPGGKVDSQTMIRAFDTCLGSADHLSDGDFLIETLVGAAVKNLVEKDARLALQYGVFSPDEMEAALEVLVARDRPLPDATRLVAGEMACSLDLTQYLFGVGEGSAQTLRPERIDKLRDLFGGQDSLKPPTPEEVASLTADRVANNLVNYYQEWSDMSRTGYPGVKARDLDEMTKPHVEHDYVSRAILPSLSRVYQLANRQEASRRATQLTYAIHLHKARTGQWPQSLDDLPPRYAQQARIDPFSGRDFVYRPTGNGFMLYSTSENGRDDKGVHHPRWGDAEEQGERSEQDDHVFWPPL